MLNVLSLGSESRQKNQTQNAKRKVKFDVLESAYIKFIVCWRGEE